MKRRLLVRTALTACLLCVMPDLHADNSEAPCLLFSGKMQQPVIVEISKYNRITFRDDSFLLTSTKDSGREALTLDYALFNRVAFKNAYGSGLKMKDVADSGSILLEYSPTEKHILLHDESDSTLNLTILSSDGRIILNSSISPDNPVHVGHLVPGIYIASASGDTRHTTIKFKLN